MHEGSRIERQHLLMSCAALAALGNDDGKAIALLLGEWAHNVRPGCQYVAGDDLYNYCDLLASQRPQLLPHARALLRAVGLR